MPSQKPTRILFVSNDSENPYGSSHSFLSIANHYHTNGIQIGLCAIPPGFLFNQLSEWGIPVIGHKFDWQSRPSKAQRVLSFFIQKLRLLLDLSKLVRRHDFNVMYINTSSHVSPLLLAKVMGLKSVLHVREGISYFSTAGSLKKKFINGIRNRIIRSCADQIICVSDHVSATVNTALGITRATTIHNGINLAEDEQLSKPDARHQLGIDERDFVVLFVGRLHPEKGILQFINAGILARQKVSHLSMFVLGGPTDTPFFLNEIAPLAEANSREFITLAGYRSDMARYYAAADVMVHSAVYDEPLARTILEAMSYGLCVIGTRSGGTTEIITNGVDGFLVPPNDAASIADRLVMLAGDPELVEQLGRSARATIESRFTEKRYVGQISEIVRDLAEGSGRPRNL